MEIQITVLTKPGNFNSIQLNSIKILLFIERLNKSKVAKRGNLNLEVKRYRVDG